MDQGFLGKLKRHSLLLIFVYALSLLIMCIVYIAGGTEKVYPHLMYLPIAVASSAYGKKHGIIHALFSGLLIGPLMPLYVRGNIYQEPINWITRIVLFTSVALIIGFFADYDRKHRERITALLTHDVITGLKNLEALKNEDIPRQSPCTLAVVTVSEYEDTMGFFGYNYSNQFVRRFAERLDELLDPYPNVELFRYSGMQFVVRISEAAVGTGPDEVIAALSRLHRSILTVGGIPIYVEMIVATAYVPENMTIMDGLRKALAAHSYARANELNRSHYEASLESHYTSVLEVAASFATALSNHGIDAAYQYIYRSSTEEILGAELLVRWRKADGSSVRPDFFIPIIEKTDLIRKLTAYMFTRAVDFLKVHADDDCIVSINFSVKDFSDESIDYFLKTIEDTHINPERIKIEITERSLVNIEEMLRYIAVLKEHKIGITIDDFGTGYSSYQYLSDLPVDTIKIDKSIIFKIDRSGTSRSLAKSIVNFCRENNIRTVAEGVETKEMADACKEIGIDFLQGYYFHKPQLL